LYMSSNSFLNFSKEGGIFDDPLASRDFNLLFKNR
jgi:hypothetical protein